MSTCFCDFVCSLPRCVEILVVHFLRCDATTLGQHGTRSTSGKHATYDNVGGAMERLRGALDSRFFLLGGGRGSFSCIVSEARCYFYILLSSFIQESLSFKDDVRVLSNIRTMWDHIATVKTCIYQLLQSDLVWTLQVSSLGPSIWGIKRSRLE